MQVGYATTFQNPNSTRPDRDIWKEAGKQGLFGLDIPEEFGGMGADDYRFNAVAAEVISGFNAAVGSCFGIHSDVCPPYIVDLGTRSRRSAGCRAWPTAT